MKKSSEEKKHSFNEARKALQKEIASLLPWQLKAFYRDGRLPKPQGKPIERVAKERSDGSVSWKPPIKSNRATRRATFNSLIKYDELLAKRKSKKMYNPVLA